MHRPNAKKALTCIGMAPVKLAMLEPSKPEHNSSGDPKAHVVCAAKVNHDQLGLNPIVEAIRDSVIQAPTECACDRLLAA